MIEKPPLSDGVTLSLYPGPPSAESKSPDNGRAYLLILEGKSSTIFHLPPLGEVVIGRAPEVQLRLQDQSVSRRHARLHIERGEIQLADLGSHNGTRVNGVALAASRVLLSGDVIAICGAILIFQREAGAATSRPIADVAALRQRLEEELSRAVRYEHPVSLLHLDAGGAAIDRARVAAALRDQLRVIDFAGWCGADQLALVLPDLDRDERLETAARILSLLRVVTPLLRGGLASCPTDGCDADTLMFMARRAAEVAQLGRAAEASAILVQRRIAGQDVVIADPAMVRLYDLIERLGSSELPVLLCGETGTGKEVAAAALHDSSARRARPLQAVNCAALTQSLVESELFGHERGAFSGAISTKLGYFESAKGGTLFLDEIGELPLSTQGKLLRALETRRITRVGDTQERPVDFRLVAATNRNLEDEVKAGRFRQDLFFRLSAAVVLLPPLRFRRSELPILARVFFEAARARTALPPAALSDRVMVKLLQHDWPGNLRELRNSMEFLAATVREPVVELWHLPERLANLPHGASSVVAAASDSPILPPSGPAADKTEKSFLPLEQEIRELERTRIAEALAAAQGVKTRAADLLHMPHRTFFSKLKLHKL